MNFAYIAINVRNFNRKADFRENATSLNKTPDLFIIITVMDRILVGSILGRSFIKIAHLVPIR
jgi:hypothetical protein